jgi:hypothetical protein
MRRLRYDTLDYGDFWRMQVKNVTYSSPLLWMSHFLSQHKAETDHLASGF